MSLWDKEIQPLDLNNFVRSLVSDELFWSLGGISLSHNSTYEGYSYSHCILSQNYLCKINANFMYCVLILTSSHKAYCLALILEKPVVNILPSCRYAHILGLAPSCPFDSCNKFSHNSLHARKFFMIFCFCCLFFFFQN